MKKLIFILTIALMGTQFVNAQACHEAKPIFMRSIDVLKKYNKVIDNIPYAKQAKLIADNWNTIAGNSSAKVGPRKIFLDNSKVTGIVMGQTQRTFVSPPSPHNKLTITVDKTGGRAKTDVFICVHSTKNGSQQRKEYRFQNSRSSKKKTFTINNVKGKSVSVIIKNKSVGNTFKYNVRAKRSR